MPQPTAYLTSISRHRRPGGSAGQRALAALLSAMLVLGALLPGAAFANEADSEGEGSAPTEEAAAPGEGAEFEPGGEETVLEELPGAIGAQPGGDAEDTGEGAPVEAEPEQDLEVPPPPAEETATVPDDEEASEGEEPVSAEAPAETTTGALESESASAPVYEAAPPSAAPVENQPLVAPPAPPLETAAEQSETSAVVVSTDSPTPLTPAEEQPPAPRPVATAAEPTSSEGSLAGRDSHTVRPGESLWSIAEALLPEGAGNAAIAREVQRLWRLNESRIGTGDPDLLMVGTKLRLR